MTSKEQRAHDIADQLEGTAMSLNEVATPEEIDDQDLMTVVYGRVFTCDCCGWWASTDELNDVDDDDEELCWECNEADHE